ncbi:MAG: hypothetical protein HY096_09875 [Nitrospinae bacterium]|nr:hypothetical protein [Nitrospinota bacterium]
MSNSKKDSIGVVSMNLFSTDIEGSLDVDRRLRECLSDAMRSCKMSRYQIAARVSELLGRTVSKEMLDQYTSTKAEYRIPAVVLHALCFVLGIVEPFRILLNSIGCDVATSEESKYMKIAKLEAQKAEIDKEIEKIRKEG